MCLHEKCKVSFNKEDAEKLSASEIRQKYPRFFGICPDCQEKIISYHSHEHKIYGDW